MNISFIVAQVRLPIKGGCVVTCIVDNDDTATPDEMGVGAMVDATEAEGKKNHLTIIHRSGGKYPPLSPTLR